MAIPEHIKGALLTGTVAARQSHKFTIDMTKGPVSLSAIIEIARAIWPGHELKDLALLQASRKELVLCARIFETKKFH